MGPLHDRRVLVTGASSGIGASRMAKAAASVGLAVEDVATRLVEVLAAPPHVVHVEVALLSIDQG